MPPTIGAVRAVACFVLVATAATAAPRAAVDQPVVDFGTVERGSRIEYVFRVPNLGDAPLRISRVKSTCGCTVAVVSANEIPPGTDGRVAVILDTTRLAGRTSKVVSLYTDDPSQPVIPLTLTGTVVTDLVLSPRQLYLGRIRRGDVVRREVTIVPGGPTAHYVTGVDPTSAKLRVQLLPAEVPPGQRLVIELARGLPLGHFNEEIRLRTTSARDPVMTLTVFGTVEGDVVVLPPEVSFGVTRASDTAVERQLSIQNRGVRPLTVTRVTVPDAVTYDLEPVAPGREYRMRLRLRDGLRPGRIAGAVEIFTDHPDEERVVVPVYAVVRRG